MRRGSEVFIPIRGERSTRQVAEILFNRETMARLHAFHADVDLANRVITERLGPFPLRWLIEETSESESADALHSFVRMTRPGLKVEARFSVRYTGLALKTRVSMLGVRNLLLEQVVLAVWKSYVPKALGET